MKTDPKWREVLRAVAGLRDPRDIVARIHVDEETRYPLAFVVESPTWGTGRAEVPREIDRGCAIDDDFDWNVEFAPLLSMLTSDLGRRVAAADPWYAEFLEMVDKREQRRLRMAGFRAAREAQALASSPAIAAETNWWDQ